MAANAATKSNSRPSSATSRQSQSQSRPDAVEYARQTAERSVNVPVGAAMSVVDRVNELVEPWTSRTAAERELKSLRTQVTREVNKLDRRGASARRNATRRVRTTRNRVERDVNKRRRSVEIALKHNRTEVRKRLRGVEGNLKKAQTNVQGRVSGLV